MIRGILHENDYPERFISKKMQPDADRVQLLSVEKKPLYITLPFKGDSASELLLRKLNSVLKKTFHAARLACHFKTRALISVNNKDKLPLLTSSMVVYSFRCVCDATYIGRTTRQLVTRIQEHCPKRLPLNPSASLRSAIVAHLVDTGHQVDINKAFKVIYRVAPSASKAVRTRTLEIAEAISIRLKTPILCKQTRLTRALQLNWPSSHEGHVRISGHAPAGVN